MSKRLSLLVFALVVACGDVPFRPTVPHDVTLFSRVCEGYSPWEVSPDNLPYPVNPGFVVIHGNGNQAVLTSTRAV